MFENMSVSVFLKMLFLETWKESGFIRLVLSNEDIVQDVC